MFLDLFSVLLLSNKKKMFDYKYRMIIWKINQLHSQIIDILADF